MGWGQTGESQFLVFGGTGFLFSRERICLKAGDTGVVALIPGSRRSAGGGQGNPLQCSCLENTVDRGAWWATVHRVSKSQTRLKQLGTCGRDHNLSALTFSFLNKLLNKGWGVPREFKARRLGPAFPWQQKSVPSTPRSSQARGERMWMTAASSLPRLHSPACCSPGAGAFLFHCLHRPFFISDR